MMEKVRLTQELITDQAVREYCGFGQVEKLVPVSKIQLKGRHDVKERCYSE
jgi:hypothetical protein